MELLQQPVTVSVFILVYNQEGLVTQMIESILAQQTQYRFELVIGDDASTDATLAICKEYQQRFPDQITLVTSPVNTGLIQNFIRTLQQCTGNYIAICDGDDYWTDPLKLEKQVSFLEAHPNYDLVFAQKKDLWPDGSVQFQEREEIPETTSFEDLIQGNYIASVTAVFRNKIRGHSIPSWWARLPYGDWPLYLWTLADGGSIKYLKEPVAMYRMAIGQSAQLRKKHSDVLLVKRFILSNLQKDPHFVSKNEVIQRALKQVEEGLMRSFQRERNLVKGTYYFWKCFWRTPSFRLLKTYLGALFKKRPKA